MRGGIYFFFSSSSLTFFSPRRSPHLLITPVSMSPRAKLREAELFWMDGRVDGGWTDRKHLSPITTEENHII